MICQYLSILTKTKKIISKKSFDFYVDYLIKNINKTNLCEITKLLVKNNRILESKHLYYNSKDISKLVKNTKKMFYIISSTPVFLNVIMNELDMILDIMYEYDYLPITYPISGATTQLGIITINKTIDKEIEQIMLYPTKKLKNKTDKIYNRRILICNCEGYPNYMKLGFPYTSYNTNIIVTESITNTTVSPNNTLHFEDTIFGRSNFDSDNITADDLPTTQIMENTFSTKIEIYQSGINDFGYSIRNSLLNNTAYYVARKFTNSLGMVFFVRLSYH